MTPSKSNVDKCFDFSCSPKVRNILNGPKLKKLKKLPAKPKEDIEEVEEDEDSEESNSDKVFERKEEKAKIVVREHVADEPEKTTYEGDDTPEVREKIAKNPKIKKILNTKPKPFNQTMRL